ncbi:RagB/SusD family nutrient uptake outer membrane protein [Arachidicoccus ginsenosidivorans]|uniref:RagB/SusD family nutrient uptake outer membrane protein n=1 Tax=Arachidicoccus ginsenosidivorans TaxID=496057 RepID=UPI003742F142
MGSDDAIKGSVATDATYINEYDNFTVDASEGQLDGFWTAQYQNINLCNQVLANVPAISMDASLKSRYEGEAKFIRAWSYFRLVRAFGNIPLIMKLPQTAEELNPKQSTAAEVYAAIDQDLTEAAGLLPATYGAADVGRATKGAALSLHAKVDMYEAGKDASKWQNVLDYTNSVIQSGSIVYTRIIMLCFVLGVRTAVNPFLRCSVIT